MVSNVFRFRRLAGRAGSAFVDYAELLIALGVAGYATYASAFDKLGPKGLLQATAGLLLVLAFAMVRERRQRLLVAEEVRSAVRGAAAARPWRVLAAEFSWELHDRQGQRATGITKKDIRIEQDDVYSLYEWSAPPVGTVTSHACRARFPGTQGFQELPILTEDLPGPDGRTYRIISLDGVRHRGERLEYESRRQLEGFFLEARENVSVNVEIPTDRLTLDIRWPSDRPPRAARLERTGKSPTNIDVGTLRRTAGCKRFRETLTDPQLGERITVSWSW